MSAGAAVEKLGLELGDFQLSGIDFVVPSGKTLVILGPNGCGKSVTLETIAGFHRPDTGRVRVGGRDVTALPPERRNVAFVVQNFGLFPHLTVEGNVAISRRRERKSPAVGFGHDDTTTLLNYFGIAKLARRFPADLSQGEKQRVALARALAATPDLFLFDEPFSSLDAQTHDQLRGELKSFLRQLAIPAVFVTHENSDALALADMIVVLRDGAIVQSGRAAEIFQKPANSFVARLIGVENILDGRIADISGRFVTIGIGNQVLHAAAPPRLVAATGKPVRLSIRAEEIAVSSAARDATLGTNCLDGNILALHDFTPLTTIEINCGFPVKAYVLTPQARAMNLGVGDAVTVKINPDAIHLMTD
jgi:molybdate/tungstate transport system ATP-binding protein